MAASPVIKLVNVPVAAIVPCSVLVDRSTVGLVEVLHTTPYCVGLGTPKLEIFPFPVAVAEVMLLTTCVVTVGAAITVSTILVVLLPPALIAEIV